MNNTLFLLKHTEIQTTTKLILWGQALDMITTKIFLHIGMQEGNPIVLMLGWPISDTIKIINTLLFCFFIQYFASIEYKPFLLKLLFCVCCIWGFVIPLWNIVNIFLFLK